MSAENIEKRVEALEKEVLHLRKTVDAPEKGQGWKAFVGAFLNDPYFEQAMALGRKYRESTRPKKKAGSHKSNVS